MFPKSLKLCYNVQPLKYLYQALMILLHVVNLGFMIMFS